MISEALWCGKPVLSIPIRGAYEQHLNASEMARAGFGRSLFPAAFSIDALRDFERNLDEHRTHIRRAYRADQSEIYAALDDFIAGRWR